MLEFSLCVCCFTSFYSHGTLIIHQAYLGNLANSFCHSLNSSHKNKLSCSWTFLENFHWVDKYFLFVSQALFNTFFFSFLEDWIALVKAAAAAAAKNKAGSKPRTSANSNKDKEDRKWLKVPSKKEETSTSTIMQDVQKKEEEPTSSDTFGKNKFCGR